MPDDPLDDTDVKRVLELADGHLEDAENVLWNASSRTAPDDLAEALEELAQEIWSLQHKLHDLQRELDRRLHQDEDEDSSSGQ